MPTEPKAPVYVAESVATPAQCERPYSAIYERRMKARRAKTIRTAVTVTSAVIAVGGAVAGIVGGVISAAQKTRSKK